MFTGLLAVNSAKNVPMVSWSPVTLPVMVNHT